jgi:hypothetical protein
MNELIVQQQNLPDKIEDLSRFVLVGREKLTAVRAEIRAIDKLKLAEDVREQKREESKMLSEAILDCEVRLGELFKEIPKKSGGDRGNQYTGGKTDTAVGFAKTKTTIVSDLGFSEKQAERFETLADNKDLVEQVKAEARENDEIPTRARVLDLAAYQKKQNDDCLDFIDLSSKAYKKFMKMINAVDNFEINDKQIAALKENFDENITIEEHIEFIDEAREKLQKIKIELMKKGK